MNKIIEYYEVINIWGFNWSQMKADQKMELRLELRQDIED